MNHSGKGVLYLCATPIGNLEDITLRVVRMLKEADLVAAEDTRHTRKLFSRYGIHTPLTSYHEHNSRSKGRYLMDQMLAGKNVALVSDAGLPGVSDPGAELVALAATEGIRVVPVPGPSASLTALVVSGLPAGRFCFEGFLPSRGKERRLRLEELKTEKRTLVLYEAPHRLKDTLGDLAEVLGVRRICVARELTKQYEEIWRGGLMEAVQRFEDHSPRGEITLVIEGLAEESPQQAGDEELRAAVRLLEQEGLPRKEAIKEASRRAGMPKRAVYSAMLGKEKRGGE